MELVVWVQLSPREVQIGQALGQELTGKLLFEFEQSVRTLSLSWTFSVSSQPWWEIGY